MRAGGDSATPARSHSDAGAVSLTDGQQRELSALRDGVQKYTTLVQVRRNGMAHGHKGAALSHFVTAERGGGHASAQQSHLEFTRWCRFVLLRLPCRESVGFFCWRCNFVVG